MIVSSGPCETPEALAVSLAREAQARGERVLLVAADRAGAHALRRALLAADSGGAVVVRSLTGLASTVLERAGERFRSGRLLGAFAARALFETALENTPTPSFPRHARETTRFRRDVARVLRDLAPLDDPERARLGAVATPHLRDLLAIDANYRSLLARAGAFDRAALVARAARALRVPGGTAGAFVAAGCETAVFCALEDYGGAGLALVAALAMHLKSALAVEEPSAALADVDDDGIRAALEQVREGVRTTVFATPAQTRSAIVEVIKARSPVDEVAAIADRIEDALESGVVAEHIGVVLREREPHGTLLERELRARAIPCTAFSDDAVYDDPAIELVRAAFALFANPRDPARWARALGSRAGAVDPVHVRLDLALHAPTDFEATLARLLHASANDGAVDANVAARRERMRDALLAAHAQWTNGDGARAARTLFRELAFDHALRGDERLAATALARMRAFAAVLDQTQNALRAAGGDASCAALAARLDAHFDAIASDAASASIGDVAGVAIVDVREAKVRSFDLVIVAGALEGRFPRAAQASPLFAPEDLAALVAARIDLPSARADGAARERRAWYVAAERGRTRTIVSYAATDAEGRASRASSAIPLDVLPPGDAPAFARPYAPPSFDAPSGGGSLDALLVRRAAAAFERSDRRPVATDAPLGVGAVDRWLQCPRKFYFDRLANVPNDENYAMRFGTALHAILERFHRVEVDFRAVEPGMVPRWTAELHALQDELAATVEPDSPPLSAYATFVLRRMLADYAEFLYHDALERPFVVEECERDIEVRLGRARLRGRIDRLDRMVDGTLAVRDYKAGRRKFQFAKALPEIEGAIAAGARLEGALDDFSAQLPLYRLALDDVSRLHVISFGGEGGASRAHIADNDLTLDATRERQIGALAEYVRTNLAEPLLDGAIARFTTTSDERACRLCDYRRICSGPRSIA